MHVYIYTDTCKYNVYQVRNIFGNFVLKYELHTFLCTKSVYVQGIDFLNLVDDVWGNRKVTDDNLKATMQAELQKWLLLLLQLVDITAPQADIHLKMFMKGRGVVKTFKKSIERAVS